MENTEYMQIIENLNAEKIALDQMYVESLKAVLFLKKELILLNAKLAKLIDEKEKLSVNENLEKEEEEKKFQDLPYDKGSLKR
jgi:hypothetical protein